VTEPAPAPATTSSPPAERSPPLTALEMWRLSIAGALVALFVLGAVAVAFDVPALQRALDLRRLFR